MASLSGKGQLKCQSGAPGSSIETIWVSLPVLNQQLKRKHCRGSFNVDEQMENRSSHLQYCQNQSGLVEVGIGIMSRFIYQSILPDSGLYPNVKPKILTLVLCLLYLVE